MTGAVNGVTSNGLRAPVSRSHAPYQSPVTTPKSNEEREWHRQDQRAGQEGTQMGLTRGLDIYIGNTLDIYIGNTTADGPAPEAGDPPSSLAAATASHSRMSALNSAE